MNGQDLHEPRARRYAEALAAAAAAEERIAELVDQVAEHEWHRSVAESEVSSLRERLDLGGQQLISSTDDPPGPEISALISLNDGKAWTRLKRGDGSDDPNYWVSAAATQRGAIRYQWPLDDCSGPFLALPYEWAFSAMNREARARDEREDRIRARIRTKGGFQNPPAWCGVPIDEAVIAVVDDLNRRLSESRGEAYRLRDELDAAQRELAALKAASEVEA